MANMHRNRIISKIDNHICLSIWYNSLLINNNHDCGTIYVYHVHAWNNYVNLKFGYF